jgi:hypothetical protein
MAAASVTSDVPKSSIYEQRDELIKAGLKESKLFIIKEIPIIKLWSGPKIVLLSSREESNLLSGDLIVKEKVVKSPHIAGYGVSINPPSAGTGTISENLYLLLSTGEIIDVEIKSSYACSGKGEIISAKLISISSSDPLYSKAAYYLLYGSFMSFKEDNDYSQLNSLLPMKYDRVIDFKINVRIANKLWS